MKCIPNVFSINFRDFQVLSVIGDWLLLKEECFSNSTGRGKKKKLECKTDPKIMP